jgi:hypothetical protein
MGKTTQPTINAPTSPARKNSHPPFEGLLEDLSEEFAFIRIYPLVIMI